MNAKIMGFDIGKKKSKIMCGNSGATRSINVGGEPLKHVEKVRECYQYK